MACIDCQNSETLPTGSIGPTGNTGPVGPTSTVPGPAGDDGAPGVDAPPISVDSITPQTISVAQHTFTTDVAFGFNDYSRVRVANSASNYMEGTVNPASTGTTLIVDVDRIVGSGTYSVWAIGTAGDQGDTGDTGAAGVAGPGYTATSSSNVAIGTGAKTFTTQAGLAYTANARVRVANSSTNYMEGTVTSYSTTSMVLNIERVVGSGTYNSWTINLAGDKGADATTPTDTGWVDLLGFSFLPTGQLPQYRVMGKQIAFRGVATIPLDDGAGVIVPYSSEASYIAATGKVTPYQGTAATGGVSVDTAGAVTFYQNNAVISASYLPDNTYGMQTIAQRRVLSDTASKEILYTAFVSVYINTAGKLVIQTLKDSEEYSSSAPLGHSMLRFITSKAVTGDYAVDYRDVDNAGGADTLMGTTANADLVLDINQQTFKHAITIDAAEADQIGGFNIRLDGLVAYLA